MPDFGVRRRRRGHPHHATTLKGLGKLLGVPYIPVTPYLLPVPRPVPLEIYYSEPMVFEGTGNEEDSVIAGYVNQVKDRVATLIDQGHRIRAGRDSERT